MWRVAREANRLIRVGLVMCAVVVPAHAQYKCTGTGGAISFQQTPCYSRCLLA